MADCNCGDYLGTLGSNPAFELPEYYWNVKSQEQRIYLICRRIEELNAQIEQNKADIATNKANIAKNSEDIASNKAAIVKLSDELTLLQTELAAKYDELKALCDKLQEEIDKGGAGYTLPVATDTVLGGVKIGDNLTITDDGVLSATGGGGAGYTLPVATTSTLGGIKVGSNLFMDEDGVLSGKYSAWDYGKKACTYTKEIVTIDTDQSSRALFGTFNYYRFIMFATGDSFTIPAHGSVTQSLNMLYSDSTIMASANTSLAIKALWQDGKAAFDAYLCRESNGWFLKFTNNTDSAIAVDSSTYTTGSMEVGFIVPANNL